MKVDIGGKTIELDVDADLALSEETLDQDMCSLPRTIGKYAEIMGVAHVHASNMKHNMEVVEAVADQAIRAKAQQSGEKTTEPAIKQQVSMDPAVQAARRAYYAADGQHKTLEGLYRALRDKSNIAIAICYKMKEEIRVMNSPIN